MSAIDPSDSGSVLDEVATGWLLEREEGFGPGRAQAFAEWCDRDPKHAKAVSRVEETLSLLNEMVAVRAQLEARIGGAAVKICEPAPAIQFNLWRWTAGLAAALVLGAVGWWFVVATAQVGQTYVANSAEPRRVALSDGSVVDLNSNSRLREQFSERERRVTLGAGEAHFQVAHNAARPFIVTASGISVRAVGTAFNVRVEGDRVDVLVTDGKVEIDREFASSSPAAPLLPLLVAGERTQIFRSPGLAPRVEGVSPAAVHALLFWQDRITNFTDVPLREMVARINRCNSTQLVLEDPELGARKIGGVIRLDRVDSFVQLLEQDGDIVAKRGAGGKIVLLRAR